MVVNFVIRGFFVWVIYCSINAISFDRLICGFHVFFSFRKQIITTYHGFWLNGKLGHVKVYLKCLKDGYVDQYGY